VDLERRNILGSGGKMAAFAALLGAGLLRPSALLAAWNQRAFDAMRLNDALAALGIQRPAQTKDIVIDAPDVADNGAFVPVQIVSNIPGTETLAVFVDKNPWPHIARFHMSPGAVAFIAMQLRMKETSPVRVVAEAGGKHYVAAREVRVTVGGCGNEGAPDTPFTADKSPAIRIRARLAGDVADVRALMKHPMENGLRKNAAGQPIPEHFIRNVRVELNGRTVLEAETGRSVSANPLFRFKLKGATAGDRVALRWEDSLGAVQSGDASVAAS
jgi:quinoprotein dehydrogenase-associated SoxYZ-like carrier